MISDNILADIKQFADLHHRSVESVHHGKIHGADVVVFITRKRSFDWDFSDVLADFQFDVIKKYADYPSFYSAPGGCGNERWIVHEYLGRIDLED